MRRKAKVNNPEAVGGKEIFGVTALSTMSGVGSIFMSSMFMVYMTDYAGLGAWGATLATTLLLVARIVDAIDDPIQGFIMDSAKVGKHGKYKIFYLISIIMTAVGTVALYSLPRAVAKIPVLVTVWVIFFYFVYDIGTSFYNQNLLYRTITNDPNERAKLLVGPRLWTMLLSMVGSAMTAIAVSIQAVVGSYNTAFMILATVTVGIAFVVSVIGWVMVKERHVVEQKEGDKVRLTDFFELLKTNKAMLVNVLHSVFAGFIWTFLFAAPSYYVKWAFCTDLSTGEVNMGLLGIYSLIVSLMMIFPIIFSTIIATPILKAFKGDFIKMHKMDLLLQGLGGLVIFVAHITGIAQAVPAVFFVGMFVMAFAVGLDFVPGCSIGMEVMDYTIYLTGKDRSALTGVLDKFLEKAQNAVSSALVGGILIAIGYEVDSVTGDYIGELSALPPMLTWMTVVMGLIPAILAVIAVLIINHYPVDQAKRKEIQTYINEHQDLRVTEE